MKKILALTFLFSVVLSLSSLFILHYSSLAALPSSALFLSHFDETTKNERNGDLGTSSGISYASGKFFQGVKFDGTDYLYYSASGSISPGEGTVEFWYKPSNSWDSENDPQVQLFHYDDNNQDTGWFEDWISVYGVKSLPPNPPRLVGEIGVGGSAQMITDLQGTPWAAGSLHHIAITWSSSVFRLYVDGTLRGQINNPTLPSSRDTVFVGNDMYRDVYSADGVIDELLISNYAKTASEIEADFKASEPFYVTPPPVTCTCGGWSSWTNGSCGEGTCSSTKRYQYRTRDCNPDACKAEKEERCVDDLSCLPDTEPPKVSWDPYPLVFKAKNPVFTGKVSDNQSGVASLSFTLDGENFFPLKAGERFEIRFTKLEDGDYRLRVKAVDKAGNETLSTPARFVIDTLPPRLGGNAFFLGSQKLFPGEGGFLSVSAGSQLSMVVSAVGGPVAVEIKTNSEASGLQPIAGTSLWRGQIAFEEEGSFDLEATSADGAGNIVTQKLTPIWVSGRGVVRDSSGDPVEGATVTLYVFQNYSSTSPADSPTPGVGRETPGVFLGETTRWEAEVYGQENPQRTDKEGRFNYLLPAGSYQLTVSARGGYRDFISEPFIVEEPTPINPIVVLEPRPGVTIFGRRLALPWFLDIFARRKEITLEFPTPGVEPADLGVGKRAPDFILTSTLGGETSLKALRQRKVLITFWASWDPLSVEQIALLDQISLPRGAVLLPVALQESLGKVTSFLGRGRYLIPSLVDETGALLESYRVLSIPQHFLIGEDGRIMEVKVGVLSAEEVLELVE